MIEEALDLIHEIKERGLLPKPKSFHMLVKDCAKNGKMDYVMQSMSWNWKITCPMKMFMESLSMITWK